MGYGGLDRAMATDTWMDPGTARGSDGRLHGIVVMGNACALEEGSLHVGMADAVVNK